MADLAKDWSGLVDTLISELEKQYCEEQRERCLQLLQDFKMRSPPASNVQPKDEPQSMVDDELRRFREASRSQERGRLLESVIANALAKEWKLTALHKHLLGQGEDSFSDSLIKILEESLSNDVAEFQLHQVKSNEEMMDLLSQDQPCIILPRDGNDGPGPDIICKVSTRVVVFIGVKQTDKNRVEGGETTKNRSSTRADTLWPKYENKGKTTAVPSPKTKKTAWRTRFHAILEQFDLLLRIHICLPTGKEDFKGETQFSPFPFESTTTLMKSKMFRRPKRLKQLEVDLNIDSISVLLTGDTLVAVVNQYRRPD